MAKRTDKHDTQTFYVATLSGEPQGVTMDAHRATDWLMRHKATPVDCEALQWRGHDYNRVHDAIAGGYHCTTADLDGRIASVFQVAGF